MTPIGLGQLNPVLLRVCAEVASKFSQTYEGLR